ncbi:hypothetical protein [Nonomuraea sp. NPDC050310]|uniref:hypothetical protein n=1 Tax=unclassified Nonomuraea TaxID=2593643 RepID=UPI0033F3477C
MSAEPAFNHRPKVWPQAAHDDEVEDPDTCWVCGVKINPRDRSLHAGELAPSQLTDPDEESTRDYVETLLRTELADTPVSLLDSQVALLARRAAAALYARGAIRPRRSDWRPRP